MINPTTSIIKQVTSQSTQIACATYYTHSPFEAMLCKTNHLFYACGAPGIIPGWNPLRPQPPNYINVTDNLEQNYFPDKLEPQISICQNVDAQYKWAKRLSVERHINILNIFHTSAPVWHPQWRDYAKHIKENATATKSCFITEYSRDLWGFSESEGTVITHGADLENFKPLGLPRQNFIMYVCNKLEERDAPCGFTLWETIRKNFKESLTVGDSVTPGYSQPIRDPAELNTTLNHCGVYVNCTRESPMPVSLIEALAAGTPIVSTSTCAIPEFLTHKHDCFLFPQDRPELAVKYITELLNDKDMAIEMGLKARETALKFFDPERFIREWRQAIIDVAEAPYLG